MSAAPCAADALVRLRASREQLRRLVLTLKEDADGTAAGTATAYDDGFPRSALMRAVMRHRRGLGLGAAAMGLLWIRPRLTLGAAKWAVTRPLVRRTVLPFVLRRLLKGARG